MRGRLMMPRRSPTMGRRRFHPSAISGLVMGLESWNSVGLVSGAVDSWTDNVGGLEFAAVASGNRPTHGAVLTPGGRPALGFNGTSHWLLGPNALSSVLENGASSQFTVSTLLRPTAGSATYLLSKYSEVAPGGSVGFGGRDAGALFTSLAGALGYRESAGDRRNAWAAVSWVIDIPQATQADRQQIYVGGAQQATTRWLGTDPTQGGQAATAIPLRIGCREFNVAGTMVNFFAGQLAAIYIHDRILAAPELTQMSDFMGSL